MRHARRPHRSFHSSRVTLHVYGKSRERNASIRKIQKGRPSLELTSAITQLFTKLLNLGTGVGVVVASFFIMWGAYQYMAAAGSPRQMESGKHAMFNAIAGLAIVLAARVIAGMIQNALTGVNG